MVFNSKEFKERTQAINDLFEDSFTTTEMLEYALQIRWCITGPVISNRITVWDKKIS